jgi:hypothetical protein
MPAVLALLLFVSTSMVLPVPAGTPIPCLICQATVAASATTFSGTVARNDPTRLRVYNSTTLRSMEFVVPPDFHGVDSGDGVVKGATVAHATPGLLARVTYTSSGGRNLISKVLLLTVEQCRSLVASERLTNTKTECPD